MNGNDIKEAYGLGRQNNNELSADMLLNKDWNNEKIKQVIGVLVQKRLAYLKKTSSGKAVVVTRDETTATQLQGLTSDDYAVYCAVEESAHKGIWSADLRRKPGVQQHTSAKSLKTLTDKKLIKIVKNIHQKNRKIYILYHLEPSKDIAGGNFYVDGEFNEDLVERLREQVIHVLKNGQQSTFSNFVEYIKQAGFGAVRIQLRNSILGNWSRRNKDSNKDITIRTKDSSRS
eukprot:GHVP01004802.1.p2 GENE.GHVP01004802.1~~GHVP01004802.1.p2  ORF type:complete len:231 (-),score=44.11 GHVP01004802.1:1442-2134(-)